MITHLFDLNRDSFNRGVTATIGSFDGLHSAHCQILDQLKKWSVESNTDSAIITFEPHPRIEIEGDSSSLRLLTTIEEKISILSEIGIDHLIVLRFDDKFRSLKAEDFVEDILCEKINCQNLLVGYDNKIGSDKKSTFDYLSSYSDISCRVINPILEQDQKISSTRLRNLIVEGEIERANELLGRSYRVISTINPHSELLLNNKFKLIPQKGEYFGLFDNLDVNITIGDQNRITINKVLPDCVDYNSNHIIEFIAKR